MHLNSIQYFNPRFSQRKERDLLFNIFAFLMISMVFAVFAWGFGAVTQPVTTLNSNPITLDCANLAQYSGRTLLRMLCAMTVSFTFTLIYAGLAAKNKYLEQILVPILDILQSVPILGYTSFTVTAFLALAHGSVVGAELVSIFAIFTSQVWNMIFSFYESLKTVPKDLVDVSCIFNMTKWQKFWRLELPYAIPPLIWNMVLSMSGGWIFVVASEVITVGNTKITLPGIGSYISLALLQQNVSAIIFGMIAMVLVIVTYDQLLIRPLVAWSDKFRDEVNASQTSPKSWVLSIFYKSNLIKLLSVLLKALTRFMIYCPIFKYHARLLSNQSKNNVTKSDIVKICEYIWYASLIILGLFSLYKLFEYFHHFLNCGEVLHVFKLTVFTLSRVMILVIIASIIWVPIGIYIGLHHKCAAILQPIIQLMASFPVNLLFPLVVTAITHYKLNPNIWLSMLMIIGTQWYILFNVIAAVTLYPNELKEVVKIFNIKGWTWWKKVILPIVIPQFVVGIITAFGASWNMSIITEVVNYGSTTIAIDGVGSYIANYSAEGDFPRIMLGILMMIVFVVLINRLIWKPILHFVNYKYSLS